jgi:REP element-mobilizing transposase RayT
MTIARRSQVSLDATPYYHCIARCVRRAFLCGEDQYSGQNFNHRRQWLVDRLQQQASIFSIDICAYAIMGNHYHLVLRVDCDSVAQWSNREVMERWCGLFRGPLLVQHYLANKNLSAAELDTIGDIAALWRERLSCISWFMRCLNEFIARKANLEDDCKGRFWEGRFTSQALLDDAAVLSCMAYVDLNPVRAAIATDLESSDFTSIQARLRGQPNKAHGATDKHDEVTKLLGFSDIENGESPGAQLPLPLTEYTELLYWTGTAIRSDKRGAITATTPSALNTIGLHKTQWLSLALDVQALSLRAIGNQLALRKYTHSQGKQWLSGQKYLAKLYQDG